MDIDILLFLQEFRNGLGACLVKFLSHMTFLGEMNTVLIIMALIYWCVSKEYGTYFLMGWNGNRVVNGLLKVTACAYRPWIRDARVVPDSDAIVTATGYSFPSGHTMNAASLFGGGAIRKELTKALRIVLGIVLVLIAFSRIYLGVHTPQDILIGTCAGLLVMWGTSKLLAWLEKHPSKDLLVMGAGIAIAVAVAVFAALKSYPVDYNDAGELLVDGAKMANDTYKGVGWCIGFFVGWVLEKRYIKFSTDVPMMTRVTRLATGLFCFYIISLILTPLIKEFIHGAGGIIISCFIEMFFVVFLFPLCMKRLEKTPGAHK